MQCLKCLSLIESKLGAHYGLHAACFKKWFKTSDLENFKSLTRRSSHSFDIPSDRSLHASFFHGKFKKYSADLDSHSFILKMREFEAPEMPEVEYLCNQIAILLKIPVAEFFIIKFEEDIVFVTKNFIQRTSPTDLQHIYHFLKNEEYCCEAVIKIIIEKTKQPYNIKTFIKTILFDALIGNHDRHGRNLAFVVRANNISLSPIYDNVSYLSLEKGNMLKADFNPKGKISTQCTQDPGMREYVRELQRLGYLEDIYQFYLSIKLEKIYRLIQDSFCSALMKNAIKSLINKRFEELKNELNIESK
jgi:hypothetical protein